MVATNMAQLREMIMREIASGVQSSTIESRVIMKDAISDFYAGGTPVMYERTHQLDSTPQTTDVSKSGNSAFYDAYLSDAGGYSTGKQPSMGQVLQLTNNGAATGLRPAVGSTGYWDRAKPKFQQALDDALRSRGFK